MLQFMRVLRVVTWTSVDEDDNRFSETVFSCFEIDA
jgi:hypothetical protein